MKTAIKRVSSCLHLKNAQRKVMNRVPNRKFIFGFTIGCFVFLFLVSVPNGSFNTIDDYLIPRTAMRLESFSQCVPKHHILFLKTHKCGSSTVQNIFLRFGYRKNLTFALPNVGNYFGSPGHFKAAMLPPSTKPSSGIVDIFCVHTRLEESELKKTLHNDTIWITILREPVSLYESLFRYYRLSFNYEMDLETLASKPISQLSDLPRARGGRFGYNQMLFDLGADPNISVMDLQRKLSDLDQMFDLVMIVEHIEESLILLKDVLCWTMDDMVAFTKNARRTEFKSNLSDADVVQKLRDLNSGDVLLYNHFLAKHKEAVVKYGVEKMEKEVIQLKYLISERYESCVYKEVKGKDSDLQYKEYSDLVTTYLLAKNNTEELCFTMTLPELAFVSLVRDRQKKVIEANKVQHLLKYSNRTL